MFGDDRFTTTNRRAYLSAGCDGPLGRGWSATGRLAYDYYNHGASDYGEPEPVLWLDAADSHMVTGEVTARRRFARSHPLTIGTEVRRQFRNRMWATDDYGLQLDVRRPGTFMGIYAKDEVRVFPWMIVNAGVRDARRRVAEGVFVPNVTITSPKRRRLELTVGVYNLSDTYYADPGGEEHVQQSISQDGRTSLARLRVRF